jgi:hypothetical protein
MPFKQSKETRSVYFPFMHSHAQAHDALFATELKKYDVLVADIKANAEAQEAVLTRLDKQNRVGLQIVCTSVHVYISIG